MEPARIDRVFNYGIGCVGLAGVLATVLALIWVVLNPTQAVEWIEEVAQVSPTPIVIEKEVVATATPGPSSTPQVVEVIVTSLVEVETTRVVEVMVTAPVEVTRLITATPMPDPTGTATVAVALPFEDTFDLGARPEWEPVSGTWRMIDGTYAADGQDGWAYTMVGDLNWANYVVQVDISTGCITGFPTGVLLRSKNPAEGVHFTATCCNMQWIVYHNGESRIIANSGQGLPNRCGGVSRATSQLRLEANGSIYTVYHNDFLVMTVQDETFSNGRIGLGTTHGSDRVRFDNLVITQLP